MGYWTEARVLLLPDALRTWVSNLVVHPNYSLLRTCRDVVTHRMFSRTIAVNIGRAPAREALLISTSSLDTDEAQVLGYIDELIPRMIAFGEDQFHLCCQALLSDLQDLEVAT